MTDKGSVGVTVVSHDSENRALVDRFDPKGSYSCAVTYHETSLLQLTCLAASSAHSEQFIKYECYQSMLLYNGAMFSWWVYLDDEKMTYWGGVDSVPPHKYACSLTKACANQGYGCSCDANDFVWRKDNGFLKNKSKLPVSQLMFGDASGAS